jgi:hypothetical protein
MSSTTGFACSECAGSNEATTPFCRHCGAPASGSPAPPPPPPGSPDGRAWFKRPGDPDKQSPRVAQQQQRAAEKAEREERKKAEQARRQQEAAAAAEAKHRAQQEKAFLASPVGRATTAFGEGAGFFHIQLEMSEIGRSGLDTVLGYSGGLGVERKRGGHSDVLAQIEDVGWRLEHVGYVYMETGQISRDKLLSSGQQVATLGKTVGHFLFRRAEPSAA